MDWASEICEESILLNGVIRQDLMDWASETCEKRNLLNGVIR